MIDLDIGIQQTFNHMMEGIIYTVEPKLWAKSEELRHQRGWTPTQNPRFFRRGKGLWLITTQGERILLDFAATERDFALTFPLALAFPFALATGRICPTGDDFPIAFPIASPESFPNLNGVFHETLNGDADGFWYDAEDGLWWLTGDTYVPGLTRKPMDTAHTWQKRIDESYGKGVVNLHLHNIPEDAAAEILAFVKRRLGK